MRIATILLFALLAMMIVSGCAKTSEKDTTQEEVNVENEPVVQDMNEDLNDLDSLEEDLVDSDLGNIDQELAEIDW